MPDKKPGEMGKATNDLLITCMDFRFQPWFPEKMAELDIETADRLSYPGSSLAVADGTLLPSIRIAKDLHAIKRVVIFDHLDCGAYKLGRENYGSDSESQSVSHREVIEKARVEIGKIVSGVTVEAHILDLEGNSSPA